MKKYYFFTGFALFLFLSPAVRAQSYTPNVSKDSLNVLKQRESMLKAHLKLNDLKIKESDEEAEVEKLRLKLIGANARAKESAAKNNDIGKKIGASATAKEIEKIAKEAKNDMNDAQKALEAYNKQLKRVDDIRSNIRVEEEKLQALQPRLLFEQK